MSKSEFKYLKEGLTLDLVDLLMKNYNLKPKEALDTVYESDIYSKLCNPATGLYFQSSLYLYSYLEDEVQHGVLG